MLALSSVQEELQEIRKAVDTALGRRPEMLFSMRNGVLIALLSRDEYGRLLQPDGRDVLTVPQAAKLTGRPEQELQAQWIATWAGTLGNETVNPLRIALGLAPVVDTR
jgi:hypothetical protein